MQNQAKKDKKNNKVTKLVQRKDAKTQPKKPSALKVTVRDEDQGVVEADVPLEEIVQRVANVFVDQYPQFRNEFNKQSHADRQKSMSIAASSLQYRISPNMPYFYGIPEPPPPPPPPKRSWKDKLLPTCIRPTPTRLKSVIMTPEQMGWV